MAEQLLEGRLCAAAEVGEAGAVSFVGGLLVGRVLGLGFTSSDAW